MPFQQATKNRFLQFDIKVTTESGFIMYKNKLLKALCESGVLFSYKKPLQKSEVKESINGFRPGDHFFGASFFHQFSFIHDKDAVAYIAYQRKIMGNE